jgi:N-acetylglucosaminyl-diphospho-decaprenol L-rhamnosyltransferase
MNEVFFIIVTYNSEKFIEKCIYSIKENEPQSGIIVVDNCSSDSTISFLKKTQGITKIFNNKNLGFGAANNIGVLKAKELGGTFVYLLNHDAYLIEPCIDFLKKALNQNVNYALATPLQCKTDEKSLETRFSKYLYESNVLDQLLFGEYNSLKCDFFQAASWFISVKHFIAIGMFNDLFFHYGEDNDFFNRLKYFGFQGIVTKTCRVVHIGNEISVTHKKNFNAYHRNRKRSKFLVKSLDLNNNWSKRNTIEAISSDLKLLPYFFLRLRFSSIIGIIKIVLIYLNLNKKIKENRTLYSEN